MRSSSTGFEVVLQGLFDGMWVVLLVCVRVMLCA